jgi:hypothetical protein
MAEKRSCYASIPRCGRTSNAWPSLIAQRQCAGQFLLRDALGRRGALSKRRNEPENESGD